MESDLQHHHQQYHHVFNDQLHHHHQQKHMNNSSGLTRYQSAPSSYFSNLLECEEFFNRPTSPETERIFARFLANSGDNISIPNQNFSAAPVVKQDSPVRDEDIAQQTQNLASINNETILNQQQQQQQSNYASISQGFFQTPSKPPLPDQSSAYRTANPMTGAGRLPPMKSGGNSSNLLRHSSSPAGLFSNITIEIENGYAVMRGMGDYGTCKRESDYSSSASAAAVSRPSAGRMSPITEMGNKNNMRENDSDNCLFDESRSNDYVTGYPIGSWNDNSASSPIMSKRLTDDDRTLSGLNASETRNRESGIPAPPMLARHLSLPKTAAEMSAIEKFLRLQDSVPCKIRAKRGFATHPRSIAERVRRTKISERMRKLQDLVPNMDKQTNTSDMLDLAVDYIKDLQRQVKTLSESRAKCTCDIRRQL